MSEVPKNEQSEDAAFLTLPYPNYYTNTSAIASTFMEFSIAFFEQVDDEHSVIKARVVMAPAHAKLLVALLAAHVQSWEKKFFEIQIPENIVRRTGLTSSEDLKPTQP
jgi:hypothetical protein